MAEKKAPREMTGAELNSMLKEKLIQYINISNDKGITDFILSAMEFYGGYCMTSQKS